jgi:hypothetical protein
VLLHRHVVFRYFIPNFFRSLSSKTAATASHSQLYMAFLEPLVVKDGLFKLFNTERNSDIVSLLPFHVCNSYSPIQSTFSQRSRRLLFHTVFFFCFSTLYYRI